MAALAVLQAGTFATGAELTAIVFSIFGDGSARFNFANASGMSTKFFSHDRLPPVGERGSYRASAVSSIGTDRHGPSFLARWLRALGCT